MIRLVDIILSFMALFVLSPMLFIVMVILKCTGEHEIFYMQDRLGLDKKSFKLVKFATMLKMSSSMSLGTITIRDDPRVLPFGKFLRASKINEIPQLINVLKGDMSLIGPRPQTKGCFDAFPDKSKETLLSVKPGLSGIGSIFFRDEQEMLDGSSDPNKTYEDIIMPYKADLEIWFIQNRSFKLYLLLMFLTLAVIFQPSLKWQKYLSDTPAPPNSIRKLQSNLALYKKLN